MMKLMSLFDGSGGFPLAGSMCGITPVSCSEIEPYPIAVTCSRFPGMKHYGDVSKVSGYDVEPVDIITFGSPCQDMSVAGKRAGLKHTDNGDEETTRSGLFMEAVRIIKEMREKTNGVYPRFAVWENVPGAFSSNGGEDFHCVLEEMCKISEEAAVMPPVPEGGWPYADYYAGDGWSVAYRVLDAQYWGVPQRRRRIYLVADFASDRAGEILFKRDGLRGYPPESGTEGQGTAADAQGGAGASYTLKIRSGCDGGGKGALVQENLSATLSTNNDQYLFQAVGTFQNTGVGWWNESEVAETLRTPCGGDATKANLVAVYDCRRNGDGNVAPTLTGDHQNRVTDYSSVAVIPINDKATRYKGGGESRNHDGSGNGLGVGQPGDPAPTLTNGDRHGVCYAMQAIGEYKESQVVSSLKQRDFKDATDLVVAGVDCRNAVLTGDKLATLQAHQNGGYSLNATHPVIIKQPPRYIVRRLTPTECARLQGFQGWWGDIEQLNAMSDDDAAFWQEVKDTHNRINGKKVKKCTKEQLIRWHNALHTDSAEYKMWGNGIALPCALYVMQGIAEETKEDLNV